MFSNDTLQPIKPNEIQPVLSILTSRLGWCHSVDVWVYFYNKQVRIVLRHEIYMDSNIFVLLKITPNESKLSVIVTISYKNVV